MTMDSFAPCHHAAGTRFVDPRFARITSRQCFSLRLVIVFGISLVHNSGSSQEFTNLGFENATPSHTLPIEPFSSVFDPIGNLLPFWSLNYRNTVTGESHAIESVNIDLQGLGGPYVSLVSRWYPTISPIDGRFSVLVLPIPPGSVFGASQYDLYQSATVPVSAKSVELLSLGAVPQIWLGEQMLDISIGLIEERVIAGYGDPVPLNRLRADVAGSAGKLDTLRLRFQTDSDSLFDFSMVDSVKFSTEAIPEPSVFSLLIIGLAVRILSRYPKKLS